jgi:hypothetical protein
VVAAIAASSCGNNNPSTPSDVNLVDERRVTEVDVRCPEYGESSQCTAFAIFSDVTGQEVTLLATWSTGDGTIATVNSTGVVTAYRAGEVAVRAAYRGVAGAAAVWAQPGQGLRGTSRSIDGTVISSEGGGIQGVLIQILDGPNANRTTTSFANGVFLMDGLNDGKSTVRFSKPGYVTAEVEWWIPGGKDRFMVLRPSPR